MKIGVITDSTSALTEKRAEELGIEVVPLYIHRGDEYRKADSVKIEDYYSELDKPGTLPTTSQPSPEDFVSAYKKVQDQYDALIVVTISTKLSGTFDSANLAAKMVQIPVKIVDSKLTNYGLGFLAENLVYLSKKGTKLETLVEYANNFYKSVRTIFSVDSLDHLYRGGRIGKAKALMGGLLNMKPIISLEEGELKPLKNVRGRKKLFDELFSSSVTPMAGKKLARAAVVACRRDDDVSMMSEKISAKFPGLAVFKDRIEPVISTHLGTTAFGVITEWTDRK
ncbi:MAG TPA: DegV family protein [Kosmotogaceae bacterium]|nr:MAG: DegV family protein [Thermotogales bacterium 46_20]HAA85697.1 DegV family protein [Kosmotogaceae bacterium]